MHISALWAEHDLAWLRLSISADSCFSCAGSSRRPQLQSALAAYGKLLTGHSKWSAMRSIVAYAGKHQAKLHPHEHAPCHHHAHNRELSLCISVSHLQLAVSDCLV